MERDGISKTQWMAIVWCGLLAPAAELFPGMLLSAAGRAAWLAPLAACPLVLASGCLLWRLTDEEGLARGIRRRFGPVFGRGLLIIYIVWAQLLLTLRLCLCAGRLADMGERDGSAGFFFLVVAAVAVRAGLGKVSDLGRAGQLFLAALGVSGAAVLVLALPRVELRWLWPLRWDGAAAGIRQGVAAAGVLGWSLCAAFLGSGEERRGMGRHWLFWTAGGCFVLALAQAVMLGVFGAALAQRLDSPFFALAGSVGVEGAFQRAESLVAAVWLWSDLTLMGALIFALRAMGRAVGLPRTEKWMAYGAVLAALGLSAALFRQPGTAARWNETFVPAGNLILGLAVPFLLCVADVLFEKNGGKGTSCGQKRL